MSLSAIQQKFLVDYNKLPELSKQILTVFSLAYFETNQTKMYDLVNSSPFKGFRHGTIKLETLKEHIQKLKQLSFLVLPDGKAYRCNPEIVELAARESLKNGIFKVAARTIEYAAETNHSISNSEIFALARIALYRGDKNLLAEVESIQKALESKHYFSSRPIEISNFEVLSCLIRPFDSEFIDSFVFHENHFEVLFIEVFLSSIQKSIPNVEAINFILELCKSSDKRLTPIIVDLACEHLILQGRFKEREEIQKLHAERNGLPVQLGNGVLAIVQDKVEEAHIQFDAGINILKKKEKKKSYIFYSYKSILYFFVLLKTGESENYRTALEYSEKISKDTKHPFRSAFLALYGLCQFVSRMETDPYKINFGYISSTTISFWELFPYAISLYWVNPRKIEQLLPYLQKSRSLAKKSGYKWMEMQLLDLIAKIEKSDHSPALILKQELNSFFLSDIIQEKPLWKTILNALSSLKSKSAVANKQLPNTRRLAWLIRFDTRNQICTGIQPVEQSYSKGGWTEGKPVALKRLKNEFSKIPFLTEQDIRVSSHIKVYSHAYYGGTEYQLLTSVLIDLVGHPFLFWDSSRTRLDLERGEPELSVTEESDTILKITLHPPNLEEDEKFALRLETPSRLKIIVFSPEHRQIAKILGSGSIKIPKEAKAQVIDAITNLSSSILIQSDIGGAESQTESVTALVTPYLHLLPYDAGLKVIAFCRPFAGEGPYYKPGKGGKNLIAEISGRKLSVSRNLVEEEKQLSELLRLCPTLNSNGSEGEWILEDVETCLDVLFELQRIQDKAIIEWPEGEKFKVKNQADISKFHMGIKKDNDWFSVTGSVDIGTEEVITMQTLLELLDQTPSRFIKMNDGSFLALTDTFRKQLDELKAYSEMTKDGLRFSPLIAPLINEMTSQAASLKADKAWKAQVAKLEELKDFKPELPNTFQASLRDYQREGFDWLARLSHWGVGACLADDMGLGKTIQSLAVLLTRAPMGPSLVIAPSSVCMNWHTESMRFGPTLNTIQFGGKNRDSIVRDLKPYDLLICSYGMIQQEDVAESLKSVDWQIIILDEAQAIKNMSTKRSQAVMNLKAGFRLLTTGTPIENHLGELWNLFRFLNPGLLGSMEKFNERFAIPIEKNKDKGARNRLKKLIQPFLLRRMKNQVLDELPEKTDITLQIQLSEKEKAFYEALRLSAIKKIANKEVPPGQKHLLILAEIMKLRRACCNTKLVEAKIDLPSSKFEAFTEILEELLENKHKALVFSQFVDHLNIIKKYLEEKKIPFQYLDGSTPMKDRKLRVDAFQSGQGEVFLISLKAGGTGLNLTAADYVIHMDPWWNPAVEDQASDRAHRIGQKRPVTVYRLVAKDTIEEKIVDLHKHKRDLADSLLEETDMSGKISADELLNLLKNG
ncbi:MAG: DEAD/DEAH box helicase [Leptospiraceae bacterium]|nr:DEAD/DEAH box helicase [Leptospiraceae bacterium]